MKIVTAADRTSATGGVELNVFQISRELVRRGHQVDLLYVEEGNLLPEYREFCRSVRQVRRVEFEMYSRRPWRTLPQLPPLAPTVWHALRAKPEVLYGNRLFSAGWMIPARALARVPAVCHVHGFIPIGARRAARIARFVDRFVMISDYVAQLWREQGLDPGKIDVVHNGIDPDEYPYGGEDESRAARETLGIPADAFVVAYCGRVDPGKGVEVLLDAWRRLDLDQDQAALVILGSPVLAADPERYWAGLRSQAPGNVRWLPMRRDIRGPLYAADVVVVPSTAPESFGRTVIEGMATGRPVVASAIGGIPEILCEEFAGYLFEPGDAAALASRIAGLRGWRASDPELGRRCEQWVRQRFSLTKTVDGVERALAAAG